jgi:hypothetical protein
VYKFTSAAAVASGHRTCTLYSQFNLPSAVTMDVNLTASVNINAPEVCSPCSLSFSPSVNLVLDEFGHENLG